MIIIKEYAQNGKNLRRCDARCYNAKGKKCLCICDGINHGKGIDFVIENSIHLGKQLEKSEDIHMYYRNKRYEYFLNTNLFSAFCQI